MKVSHLCSYVLLKAFQGQPFGHQVTVKEEPSALPQVQMLGALGELMLDYTHAMPLAY